MTFRRSLILIAFAWFAIATSGCATTRSVGVRKAFSQHNLRSIAVVPVTSSSRFGMDEFQWQTIRSTYERQILEELRRLGFEVASPQQLEARLRRSGNWQTFTEILVAKGDVARRFEPEFYGENVPLEVLALGRLARASALESDALLISEIVYQSDGVCDRDPRAYSPHAVLIGDPDVTSPCVVSHFEAKLIDPDTGRTMWHNRQLRELRVDEVTPEVRLENIRQTVAGTLSGAHGLGPLAAPTNRSP